MAKLSKYTLEFDERRRKWVLENDQTGDVEKTYGLKSNATERGALKKALGPDGGSVKIQRKDGKYQEERTFPKSKDPRRSPG